MALDWTGEDVGLPWAESPESVGISSSALQRIDAFLEYSVNKTDGYAFPMAGALVARHGKVVYYKGTGHASTEKGTPLEPDSCFRIYSMTKPITSLALLLLMEEGKLTLDQPAHLYLGSKWKKENLRVLEVEGTEPVACKQDITMRHLFTHTGGLSYGFMLSPENAVDPIYRESDREAAHLNETLEMLVDRLSTLPLCCQPGAKFNYGYHVELLGRVIEVISGQTLPEFLRIRVFEPLDMRHTMFQMDDETREELVSLHCERPDGSRFDMTEIQNKSGDYTKRKNIIHAGHGLVSTFRDYARFAQFCLNKGELDGQRLLGRKTFELAVQNHLPGNKDLQELTTPGYASALAKPGLGFGLGFAVQQDPTLSGLQSSIGQFYWSGAANTIFLCDPKEDMLVMYFTQVLSLDETRVPLRTLFSNIVYGTIISPPKL